MPGYYVNDLKKTSLSDQEIIHKKPLVLANPTFQLKPKVNTINYTINGGNEMKFDTNKKYLLPNNSTNSRDTTFQKNEVLRHAFNFSNKDKKGFLHDSLKGEGGDTVLPDARKSISFGVLSWVTILLAIFIGLYTIDIYSIFLTYSLVIVFCTGTLFAIIGLVSGIKALNVLARDSDKKHSGVGRASAGFILSIIYIIGLIIYLAMFGF